MSMEINKCYNEQCIHNCCGQCQVAMKINITKSGYCSYEEKK